MVIDTSAIMAILNLESEATVFINAIASDSIRLMSMGTALELSIIVRSRKEEAGIRELEFFWYKSGINFVNFDENQLKMACYAFEHYGKGRHPASLNFGDCFAYALSKTSGQPLLFKGNDFIQTDVAIAVF
ncbi:MAG: type II toxin-antitoxin system VapC family toxin [Stanieria sp.]